MLAREREAFGGPETRQPSRPISKKTKRCRVIYVMARGNHPDRPVEPDFEGGIYRSVDGGETFDLLNSGDAPYISYAIRFGKDGTVYASNLREFRTIS